MTAEAKSANDCPDLKEPLNCAKIAINNRTSHSSMYWVCSQDNCPVQIFVRKRIGLSGSKSRIVLNQKEECAWVKEV